MTKPDAKDTNNQEMVVTVARQTGSASFGELFSAIAVYLIATLIARLLDAEALGIYSLMFTILMMAGVLTRFGFDRTALRYVAGYRGVGDREKLRGIIIVGTMVPLIASLILAVVFYAFAGPIASGYFQKPELVVPIRAIAPAIPLIAVMRVWASILQGIGHVEKQVLVEKIIWPGNRLLFFTLLLLSGFGISTLLISMTWAALIANLIALFYARRYMPIGRAAIRGHLGEWITFSLPMMVDNLLLYAVTGLDILILGRYGSSADLGIYTASIKIAQIVSLPLFASNSVFAPMIAQLYAQGERDQLRKMFQTVTQWAVTLSLPIGLMILLASQLVLSIFGPEYVVGSTALVLLVLGQMVNASTGAVGFMLIMTGYSKLQMANSIALGALNMVMLLVLVPRFNFIGAALATGLAFGLINLLRLLEVNYLLDMQPYRSSIYKPFIAGLIGFAAAWGLMWTLSLHFILESLLSVTLFMVVYVFLLWRQGFSAEDQIVLQRFRKRLNR